MIKHIFAFLAVALLSSAVAKENEYTGAGNGGAGVRQEGEFLVFGDFPVKFEKEDLEILDSELNSLKELIQKLTEMKVPTALMEKATVHLFPSASRKYKKVDENFLTSNQKEKLLDKFSRYYKMFGQSADQKVIYALTLGTTTYLFPDFFSLSRERQMAILFHESIWAALNILDSDLAQQLVYDWIVESEIRFYRYLKLASPTEMDRLKVMEVIEKANFAERVVTEVPTEGKKEARIIVHTPIYSWLLTFNSQNAELAPFTQMEGVEYLNIFKFFNDQLFNEAEFPENLIYHVGTYIHPMTAEVHEHLRPIISHQLAKNIQSPFLNLLYQKWDQITFAGVKRPEPFYNLPVFIFGERPLDFAGACRFSHMNMFLDENYNTYESYDFFLILGAGAAEAVRPIKQLGGWALPLYLNKCQFRSNDSPCMKPLVLQENRGPNALMISLWITDKIEVLAQKTESIPRVIPVIAVAPFNPIVAISKLSRSEPRKKDYRSFTLTKLVQAEIAPLHKEIVHNQVKQITLAFEKYEREFPSWYTGFIEIYLHFEEDHLPLFADADLDLKAVLDNEFTYITGYPTLRYYFDFEYVFKSKEIVSAEDIFQELRKQNEQFTDGCRGNDCDEPKATRPIHIR